MHRNGFNNSRQVGVFRHTPTADCDNRVGWSLDRGLLQCRRLCWHFEIEDEASKLRGISKCIIMAVVEA